MSRYDVPVQENGRMILPIELRRLLGVEKGDRIVLEASEDGEVRLTTARRTRREAQRRFQALFPDTPSVVDDLIAEKRAEVVREAAKGQP